VAPSEHKEKLPQGTEAQTVIDPKAGLAQTEPKRKLRELFLPWSVSLAVWFVCACAVAGMTWALTTGK
jgi:hypothetical protein